MYAPEDLGPQDRWAPLMEKINGCPYYRLLDMRIVAMGNGYARLTMPAAESLMQFYGAVHGGATASLADSAAGTSLISVLEDGRKAITVEMKLNFVAPACEGILTAEARVFHSGRSIAGSEVEVRRDDGRLVAKGMATFLPVAG